MNTRRQILILLAGLPSLGLIACGREPDNQVTGCPPIPLSDEHECALCGMIVVHFPGPKGQACLRDGRVLAFCSVHDLLAWAWQPESAPALIALHVHDLSRTEWRKPSDEAYMEARDAIYVVGHDQPGAMGHSPAPFSRRADAESFMASHGGHLLAFDQLGWNSIRNEITGH